MISIAEYSVDTCSKINTKIPPSINDIGQYSFNGCASMVSIVLPSSLIYVGNNAFDGCSNIKELEFLNPETYF